MEDTIKRGIWAIRRAKTEEEAKRAMAKTCFDCNIEHVGLCYCDKGYKCVIERELEQKLLDLDSEKKLYV